MTEYNPDINDLYKATGCKFKNQQLLREALTHSSYSNERRGHGEDSPCNERLEFLGDSVLSIFASEYLFAEYPQLPEGELTKIRAAVVCEDTLAVLAQQIGLGEHLMLGKGEEQNNGRERKSLLADAFEALLAAIYLDSGRDKAKEYLYKLLIPQIKLHAGKSCDYKSMLQQFIQETPGENIEYELTGEEGPNHDKTFFVAAKLGTNVVGRGSGKNKRSAEQEAARDALALFGVK